ncbi:MAG: Hint domain-containing protein [Paracoccaceae bacterium]
MLTGYRGTFVISSAQTEVDGILSPSFDTMMVGSQWRWWGEAVPVDGPPGVLMLAEAAGAKELHRRASRSAHRILGDLVASKPGGAMHPAVEGPALLRRIFTITDGWANYPVATVVGPGGETLHVFCDRLPPRDVDLHVVERTVDSEGSPAAASDDPGVICFTPGTMIATPDGPRQVEFIQPGDRISTRDNGAQEVVWTGSRRMTGARLYAMPQLRPLRIRAGAMGEDRPEQDLVVSPGHRMLLRGPRAEALFNQSEVLVSARDMIDDHSVTVECGLREVTYVHLMTEAHQIIWANGLETESFHPASADLDMLDPVGRESLLALMPGLADDPFGYGDYARRNLSAPEAAILRQAAA